MHRDIKSANCLLDKSNNVKLTDFGLATKFRNHERLKSLVGTPYFMAPEVILSNMSSKGYTSKADIWSFGCTVVEMLTGKPPWAKLKPLQACLAITKDDTLHHSNILLQTSGIIADQTGLFQFLTASLQKKLSSRPNSTDLADQYEFFSRSRY